MRRNSAERTDVIADMIDFVLRIAVKNAGRHHEAKEDDLFHLFVSQYIYKRRKASDIVCSTFGEAAFIRNKSKKNYEETRYSKEKHYLCSRKF